MVLASMKANFTTFGITIQALLPLSRIIHRQQL